MAHLHSVLARGAALLLMVSAMAGCSSSSRTTVDGYDDSMLSRKRIMVLTPAAANVRLSNQASYAASRGVATESALEQLGNDFRTRLVPAIGKRLDSNTVLHYGDQAVAGIVPLNATTDFNGVEPKSWENLKRAAREGNIDFLIVLNGMSINTSAATDGSASESIEGSYSLLDVQESKMMTSGKVSISASAANAAISYDQFAGKLTAELPFHAATPGPGK